MVSLFKGSVDYFFFLSIEFIEVILVNKIIWFPGIQFSNTSSVYCMFTAPSQVSSYHPSSALYTLFYLLPPPCPLVITRWPLSVFDLQSATLRISPVERVVLCVC